MNLIFDIDDTLMDTAKEIVEALNLVTGKDHNHKTLPSYNLDKLYDMQSKEIQSIIVEHRCLEKASWSGSQLTWNQAIWRWADEGHQIVYCTARAWHPDAEKISNLHINAMGEVPSELCILDHDMPKIKTLLIEGLRGDILVDDSLDHNLDAATNGCTAVLFTQPWNYKKVWGNRVSSQEEIVRMVDAKIGERRGYAEYRPGLAGYKL